MVLNNTGNTTALLTSFNALDASQQKVLLSSKMLNEQQKSQCVTMATLSAANVKYTAEELAKVSGISAETMANWGLTQSTDTLTMSQLAELASSDAQAKATLEKIIAQNAQKVANGEVIASNVGLATSEGSAALATGSFTTAIKANISAMWTWMTTTPIGWLTLLAAGIFTAVKAYDLFTISIEEQKEAMEESIAVYETAQSELSDTASELESNEKAMSELLSKDKLTFVEKGQLEELREINAELRIQKDLKEKTVDKAQKDAAIDAAKLYKKQFGDYDISSKKIDEYEQNADLMGNNSILITDEDDISSMLAGYRQFIELREQAFKDGDQYNIDHFTELTGDIRESLFETAQELQTQKEAMSDYYTALKDIPYDNLTSEQKEVVDAYNNTSEAILLIYKELDRAMWNELQFNKVTQEFSDTTQELQKLGKEGKVTAEMLNDPKYDAFIQKLIDIEFISDDTEGSLRFVASAFNGTMQSAQKYVTSLKGNEINNFVKDLKNEAKALGTTESELAKLTAAHVIFNDTGLSTEQQQQALQMLATKIATTATEMKYLLQLFNVASGNFDAVDGSSTMTEQERRARTVRTRAYLKEKYGIDLSPITIPEKEDDNPYDTDTGTGKSAFDDNYYSLVEAWLEDNKKEIDRLKKEQEDLNRQFENALETGNKDRVEILRAKLTENNKAQKDALHRQNNAHRTTKQDLMESLYQIAPELNGKSWEEISEVDLVSIENRLSNAAEETETSKKNNNKDKAKLQLNTFKGIVEDIKKVDNIIKENSDSWWDADENAKKYWASQIDFQDEYSRNWIENQKSFDKLTDEEELAAYGRMIYNNKEFQKRILNDISLTEEAKIELIKSTNDKILDIEKDAYDKRKELFDSGSDFGDTYIESKKTLLESYYDVTNSIAEAQHEINKELETSKTMYEYLDEDTRKLLFNQEDYNELSEELLDIQYRADKLQRQYKRDLDNSTLETIESITSNYQMQYETLMKSYEIAKADLEIAKKKQKLNNVLNERNVRMFINGSWQWVANTEDVANAKSELADAEYAKRVEEAGLTQQQSINNLTKQQDELSVVIKSFENGVIDLEEAVKQAEKAIGNMPNALASIFNNAKVSTSSSSYSTGSTVYGGNSGGGSNSSYISWAKSQMAENSKNWHTADENGKRALEAANQSLGNAIGSTFDPATGTWKHKYAMGTKYTKGGSALMGEEGEEFYVSANGRLIPITQPTIGNIPGGGVVFNREQMKNLRTMWDMSNLNFKGGSDIVSAAQPQQIDQSQDNRIIINGMTVDSGSADGQALISALRRYVGNH